MRNLTGLDAPVFDYVMEHQESEEFYSHLLGLIEPILPGYQKEGKSVLTIAVGCTGGQHRSVAFAKRLADDLEKIGMLIVVIVIRTDGRRRSTAHEKTKDYSYRGRDWYSSHFEEFAG